jgi:hypothetical protein
VDCAYDRVISKNSFLDVYANNPFFNQKAVKKAFSTSSTQHSFETLAEERDKDRMEQVNLIDYFNVVEDKHVIVANGIVIYDAPMPIKMLPIAHYKNRLKIGSFFSLSERDLIKDIAEEKDVHRNMIIDFNKFNIHSPILTNSGVEFDEEANEFAPGAIWRVGDVSQVTRLQMNNIINAPFETESMFDADITKVTGVDVNSLVSDREESATKTISKKRNQLSRLEPMLAYNSLTADVRLVKIIMEYVDTFYALPLANSVLTEEEAVQNTRYREARVEGYIIEHNATGIEFKPKKGNVDFFDVTPDILQGEFDVRVATDSEIPVSKELKQQKALELLGIVNSIPLTEEGKVPPHIEPILKMLLESGDFDKTSFERLFTVEEEEQTEPQSVEQILGGAAKPAGNQQPGRAATPEEIQFNGSQKPPVDPNNAAMNGQLMAQANGM